MSVSPRPMLHCSKDAPRRPRRGSGVAGALALALMSLSAPPASAEDVLGLPIRVGVSGGYQLTSSDFDVLGERQSALQPGDGGLFGLRLGWHAAELLELELAASLVPASTPTAGADALLLPAHLDLVVRPFGGAVTPYVSLGTGVMALVAGDAGHDADLLLHGALGVEVVVDHAVAFRLEASLYGTDGVDGAMSMSPVFTFGVDVLAWRPYRERIATGPDPWRAPPDVPAPKDPPPPRDPKPTELPVTPKDAGHDRDDDGVDDVDDRCPAHSGRASLYGCPDSDRDGIIDPFDRCPTRGGTEALGGCPDRDGDGLEDANDACPDAAGPAETYGCPRS